MKKLFGRKPVQLLIALFLFLFFVGLSVVITIGFRPLYYSDISRYQLTETVGMPEETIRKNYDVLIDYSLKWEDTKLSFPDFPMSREGETHFAEVKEIFDAFKWMALLCGIAGGILAAGSLLFGAYRFLKYEAVLSLVIPSVLFLYVGLFFEKAFVQFHQLFFSNDYWMFDEELDPVIRILPEGFFMHCAFLIFGIIFFFALFCLAAYFFAKRKELKGNRAS